MCELLGMECNTPTDLTFSFTGFARRGGHTGPHRDGWGLAFYEGRAARVFLDPEPCADSPLSAFLRGQPIKTELAIAHIRKRTRGPVTLANTHPFQRELWGRTMVFAHNGTVKSLRKRPLSRFRPVGNTDSEHAFCVLLERMGRRFGATAPSATELGRYLAGVASELSAHGVFNFLLGDGKHLFARCDTRLSYLLRAAPFGQATLADHDLTVDFSQCTTPRDRVAIVATAPLTRDESWVTCEPGALYVFQHGRLLRSFASPNRHKPVRIAPAACV